MRHPNMVILASLVLIGTPVPAAEFSYSCVVDHLYGDLDLPRLTESDIDKGFQSYQFEVSRSTGEIVGDILNTSGAESTRVMDRGSKAMSFKAVAIFTGHVQVLEIREFSEGSEKPFIALSLGGLGVFTGVCK